MQRGEGVLENKANDARTLLLREHGEAHSLLRALHGEHNVAARVGQCAVEVKDNQAERRRRVRHLHQSSVTSLSTTVSRS